MRQYNEMMLRKLDDALTYEATLVWLIAKCDMSPTAVRAGGQYDIASSSEL